MNLASSIYCGHIGHQRRSPALNEFRYSIFFLYLDLAELDRVFAGRWLWSVERHTWCSFRRRDHLRPQTVNLDQAVRDEVERQLGRRPAGPIRLLTHLRYLGYCFNPISVYYCHSSDGSLEAILTEVHNTPWGEEYLRALDTGQNQRDGDWHVYHLDKEFHVSPFMPMDIRYEWRFTEPGANLAVRMENEREGQRLFAVRLDLERRPLTGATLAKALLTWPFMTGKVIAAIYWQALCLKLKRVPFCPHPPRLNVTKGSYHP